MTKIGAVMMKVNMVYMITTQPMQMFMVICITGQLQLMIGVSALKAGTYLQMQNVQY